MKDLTIYNPDTNLASIIEPLMLKETQEPCSLVHRFSPNLYIRELTLKTDTYAIGHYHKHEHLNICLQGSLDLIYDDGSSIEIIAPFMGTSKAGRKTAYINEECVWLNIYSNPTNEQDIETLEKTLLEKNDSFKNIEEKLKLQNSKENVEYLDYNYNLPYGGYKFQLYNKAIYATGNIYKNEILGEFKNTILERYTQHSLTPNTKKILIDNKETLISLKSISGNLAGFVGEEITINRLEKGN